MLSRRKGSFLIIALLMVAVVTATATVLRLQEQGKSKPVDPNAPTPVQEGVMTEKQKRHGKLFPYHGRRLRDLAEAQGGDIEVVTYADVIRTVNPDAPKIPPLQFAMCNADAIFVGSFKSKSSQLTADESFIFTDYEMAVEEVIKNNPAAPVQAGGSVTVTREGGEIQLNGRTIRAKRNDFEAAEVGKHYLLFLRFLPETTSYLAYANGSFQIDGDKITSLGGTSRDELLNGGSKNPAAFLSEIRAATAVDCQRQ